VWSPPLSRLASPLMRAARVPAPRSGAATGPEPSFIISSERLMELLSLRREIGRVSSLFTAPPSLPRRTSSASSRTAPLSSKVRPSTQPPRLGDRWAARSLHVAILREKVNRSLAIPARARQRPRYLYLSPIGVRKKQPPCANVPPSRGVGTVLKGRIAFHPSRLGVFNGEVAGSPHPP
jgi:hypothetical protein